jgi:menaquinol-cytochrome c reductase iron-sulfur subunit
MLERRTLLGWVVKGIALAVGGVLAVPAALTVLSPVALLRRGQAWAAVGPLEEFAIGQVTKAVVRIPGAEAGWAAPSPAEKAVYVLRQSAEEIVVFSRNCTDLSCPLTWDPGSGWFYCPCHGGIFSREGDPMAGPPSRPMYRFAVRIREGLLEIDLNSVPPMA